MSVYRLAPNWITYAALTTTDAYKVSNFDVSGDYSKPWRVQTAGVVTPAEFTVSLSGKPFENGGLATEWDFGLTTPARYGWLRDTYGLGGKCTLMTYRINPNSDTGSGFGWIVMQAYFRFIGGVQPDATSNINNIYIQNVRTVFSRGVLLVAP